MRFGSEMRRKAEQIFVISTCAGTIFACCQVGRGHGNLWGWQAGWTMVSLLHGKVNQWPLALGPQRKHGFEVRKTIFFQCSHKAAMTSEELMKGNISLQKMGKSTADRGHLPCVLRHSAAPVCWDHRHESPCTSYCALHLSVFTVSPTDRSPTCSPVAPMS